MIAAASIRAAQPADVDALLALEAVFPTDRLDRRGFRHALASPTIDLLVAEDFGLVGYAMAHRRRGSTLARLTSLAVRPGQAGRGLGQALLAAMERRAFECGCARMRLEVRMDNGPAQRLYERSGYRCFATVRDYYEDGETARRYEKVLADLSPGPEPSAGIGCRFPA
jgi:ribosomal protein S18 acetylase RimI-like enzyme